MEDLTGGPRQQIAAGLQTPFGIKTIKASDQSHPRFLQQVVELFWPALLLALGCAVGQAKVLKHLLIAPSNAGGQSAAGLLPQVMS